MSTATLTVRITAAVLTIVRNTVLESPARLRAPSNERSEDASITPGTDDSGSIGLLVKGGSYRLLCLELSLKLLLL